MNQKNMFEYSQERLMSLAVMLEESDVQFVSGIFHQLSEQKNRHYYF